MALDAKVTRQAKAGDYYLHLDPLPLALPFSLTVLRIEHEPIPRPRIPLGVPSGLRSDKPIDPLGLEEIEDYLSYLLDEGYLTYKHCFVYPDEINENGSRRYLGHRAESLLMEFIRHKQEDYRKVKVFRSWSTPKSVHLFNQQVEDDSPGVALGFWLGWLKKDLVLRGVWSKLYPQYDWVENQGMATREHALACIDHGVNPHYHIKQSLKKIPNLWAKGWLEGDLSCTFGQDLFYSPPLWWDRILRSSFYCYMDEVLFNQIREVHSPAHPPEFQQWLDRNKPKGAK